MSAHYTPTLPEVQANIDIVAAVLRTCQPGHQDIPLYQNMLNDLHTELANVRQAESSTMGATFGLRYHNRTMGNVGLSGRQICYYAARTVIVAPLRPMAAPTTATLPHLNRAQGPERNLPTRGHRVACIWSYVQTMTTEYIANSHSKPRTSSNRIRCGNHSSAAILNSSLSRSRAPRRMLVGRRSRLYLRSCASNTVVVRAPSSYVGIHSQLRGLQEAVRRENPVPRDHVQRIHEESLPGVNSFKPVRSA
jgi:hypothetical protein